MLYPPPKAPAYLPASLKERFEALWCECARMGSVCRLDADLLAKYVLAEDGYLSATAKLQNAMNVGDVDAAAKWAAIQDKMVAQVLRLGAEFGLTPVSRRAHGLKGPR